MMNIEIEVENRFQGGCDIQTGPKERGRFLAGGTRGEAILGYGSNVREGCQETPVSEEG